MSYLAKYTYDEMGNLIEKLILWVGEIFIFLGTVGLILLLTYPKMYGEDSVLQFASTFMNSYLAVLGVFLVLYHGKIIVRGHRT